MAARRRGRVDRRRDDRGADRSPSGWHARIGLAIAEGGHEDGDVVVVDLSAWFVGLALDAADDAGPLIDVAPPDPPLTDCRNAAMLLCVKTHYVTVQARGTVALPARLRRRLHLDEPGAQLQIVEQDDGRLELRPVVPVPADQRWFWTERWQRMEREVDDHVAAGRVTVVDGPDALFEHLDTPVKR
jgi:AbrB family looped-hinge helix DNA binding protein